MTKTITYAFLKIFLPFSILCFSYQSFSQNIINNGDQIIVSNGAYVVITGDYINESSNGDGQINLDGKILIDGNWVNNASNTVFTNLETVPDGYVIMKGISPQNIKGSFPTHFENLNLVRSIKTLEITNCEVNGILSIDAILDLNSNKIIIDNSSPSAINYISKYILSETSPLSGYGEVQWNIGSSINEYIIPFGSGFTMLNDLNLKFTSTTPGTPASGSVSFATYPTDCQNEVLPIGVNTLDHDPKYVADRYWIISSDYTISKPSSNIVFQYLFEDVDACNDYIIQENLQAMRYNTSSLTWDDIDPIGVADKNIRTVTVDGISSSNLYDAWTLLVEEKEPLTFYFPNAFTPDNDGLNDAFGPIGIDLDQYETTLYIFDRWGELIYESNEITKPWNGKPSDSDEMSPIGVYTWLFILKDLGGEEHRYNGRVTLLK